MTHTLARVHIACLRLNVHRAAVHTSPGVWACDPKAFGTGAKSPDGDETGSEEPAAPLWRRGSVCGRRRPLCPLDRLTQLLPQNLTEELWELRGNKPREEEGQREEDSLEPAVAAGEAGDEGGVEARVEDGAVVHREEQSSKDARVSPHGLLPGERVMRFGEVLMAEHSSKRRQEFQKMFQLQEGVKLQSTWGVIPHDAMEGRPAGMFFYTNLRLPMLIRRPTLEEFTLFMKRGPAITYPKDASAMVMMMDVSEGDRVLEAGSGSGAMALFLSRAVASRGSVLSVEVREDHHRRSKLNYERWRSAWRVRTGEEWPDNVHFHHGDLSTSAHLLAGRSFNSIALDMISPHLTLPAVVPYLNSGGVCAVYLANITQVIDLVEGLRCSNLPLVCERVIEVQYRDWLLAPSLKKDGSFNKRKALIEETIESQEDDSNDEHEGQAGGQRAPFGSVPYIARPHPEQFGHTAFLAKLRKISK
ncbi:tRNA (adenine(58)-N(1))-methyltransferase, mitochondrial [Brachyhypopomus gauderio]|uniref:tRNA (adenine(58)-N(1))-methyltransferase, mitochondrial n=1 Tax=Brachyhypopomus gauderio TaxID=698409 RepID=UPI00404267E3